MLLWKLMGFHHPSRRGWLLAPEAGSRWGKQIHLWGEGGGNGHSHPTVGSDSWKSFFMYR